MSEGPDGGATAAEGDRPVTDCKVGRVLQTYDLAGVGDDLAARWTGQRGERESLRDLADRLNRRVLEAAMVEAGLSPLESDVRRRYESLSGEGVSSGVRTQTRRDLERAGVDADAVEDDFVTHQAVHTYLTKYRGVEAPSDDEGTDPEDALETIQRLRSRTVAVVENTVGRLRRSGVLETGDLEVVVDVRLTCVECGTQYGVADLLRERSCECES